MAKATMYANSKFASFCSVLGYFLIAGGVYFIFNDYPGVGAIIVVAGIALKLLAGFISKKKSEKEAKKNQDI
ncbi:MAG: hypothetical protein E7568_07040 [Ruminococcaceae bacterium]|nr:hypothetical protein [Oscillospiraceae bacterium]